MSLETQKVGDYIILQSIGKGSFGEVYKGYHKETKEEVAIKKIEKDFQNYDLVQKECDIVRTLDHPNIVKFFGLVNDSSGDYYLVFEYCGCGDLKAYIKKKYGAKVPEKEAQKMIWQVIEAVEYMKEKKIVHRDLKLDNILVTEKHQMKLADFGQAKFVENSPLLQTISGTPINMAPEVLKKILKNEGAYTDKCDIWSLGVILYQIVMGKLPFAADLPKLFELSDETTKNIEYAGELSQSLKDLIRKMLVVDVNKRINYDELFKHPWILTEERKHEKKLRDNNLQQKYELKCKEVKDLESRLASSQKELTELRTHFNQARNVSPPIDPNFVTDIRETMNSLRSVNSQILEDKDARIKLLSTQNQQLNKTNYDLQKDLEQKEKTIDQLRQQIEDSNPKTRFKGPEGKIISDEESITTLKSKIFVQEEAIKKFSEEISSQKEKIYWQENEISSQKQKISEQLLEISSQKQKISEQLLEISSQKQKISSQEQKISSQEQKISLQEQIIKDKNEMMNQRENKLEKEIERLVEENKNLVSKAAPSLEESDKKVEFINKLKTKIQEICIEIGCVENSPGKKNFAAEDLLAKIMEFAKASKNFRVQDLTTSGRKSDYKKDSPNHKEIEKPGAINQEVETHKNAKADEKCLSNVTWVYNSQKLNTDWNLKAFHEYLKKVYQQIKINILKDGHEDFAKPLPQIPPCDKIVVFYWVTKDPNKELENINKAIDQIKKVQKPISLILLQKPKTDVKDRVSSEKINLDKNNISYFDIWHGVDGKDCAVIFNKPEGLAETSFNSAKFNFERLRDHLKEVHKE